MHKVKTVNEVGSNNPQEMDDYMTAWFLAIIKREQDSGENDAAARFRRELETYRHATVQDKKGIFLALRKEMNSRKEVAPAPEEEGRSICCPW